MTVTVITGANSGIGRSTALHLAGLGHDVFATMRDQSRGTKLMEAADDRGLTLQPITLDVTDDVSVATAFDQIHGMAGRVDVLVNNAGVGHNATTEDLDIGEGQAVFESNLWGPIRCVQAVMPGMRERGEGHIVNVSSIAGRIAAIGQTAYSGSKWALEAMSENLAQEAAPFGVKVSVIEPGVTRTAILPKNVGNPEPTVYGDAYRRMFTFYAKGIAANVQPEVVAETIAAALSADPHRFRWVCAWGGRELTEGRACMSDADWISLGEVASDDEYLDRFADLFDLDLRL
jgi:NAD(P)-dependent dehydrogenase (short-subunit alcohol dehydrogenase family)